MKPFKEILKMSKEKVDAALAPVRAARVKQKAKLEIATMDEKIASQEASIHELCATKDVDFDAIIEAQDERALFERRRKQFRKIVAEMFPE